MKQMFKLFAKFIFYGKTFHGFKHSSLPGHVWNHMAKIAHPKIYGLKPHKLIGMIYFPLFSPFAAAMETHITTSSPNKMRICR